MFNLKKNTELFATWKQLYQSQIAETNNLLLYILQNYEQIQTSSVCLNHSIELRSLILQLPDIVHEPFTFEDDDSEEESDESSDEKHKKKKAIKEFGAMMELNGKLITKERKQVQHARAVPVPVNELRLLLTRIRDVNGTLLASKAAGKGGVTKSTAAMVSVCEATCAALRDTMSKSRAVRSSSPSGGIGGFLMWFVLLVVLSITAAVAVRQMYGQEFLDELIAKATAKIQSVIPKK